MDPHESDVRVLTVHTDDDAKAFEDVGHAATMAARDGVPLEIVVVYSPPSARELDRLRRIVPEEMRWRVHGTTFAEQLAESVLEIARRRTARVTVRCEEDVQLRRRVG